MCGRNVLLTRTCWEPFSPSASRLNGGEKVTGCPEKKRKNSNRVPRSPAPPDCPCDKGPNGKRAFCHTLSASSSAGIYWFPGIHSVWQRNYAQMWTGAVWTVCSDSCSYWNGHSAPLIRSNQGFRWCVGQISLITDHSSQTTLMTRRHPLVAWWIIAHCVTFISREQLTLCKFVRETSHYFPTMLSKCMYFIPYSKSHCTRFSVWLVRATRGQSGVISNGSWGFRQVL